jgi:LacI family fructose operon transcriptional repressor
MALERAGKSTIYDVAAAANTSPSTVSMVLNGTWQRYRIREETARRILETAGELGYAVNMKARALRLSRSGMAGMIIPHYRNRFFAGLAEAFEAKAREHGLCPIVVSTQRDPAIERSVVETLLSHQVEFLFITGATEPDPLDELCHAAAVPCVNVDLPGSGAASVVSDNRAGARELADLLLARMEETGHDPSDLVFIGGIEQDFATRERIEGFRDAYTARGLDVPPEAIRPCGYAPTAAREAATTLHGRRGRLPGGLFVNSITAFEGMVQFLRTLDGAEIENLVLGCFDWDPFAASLPFPVAMVRQDVTAMIDAAFAQINDYDMSRRPVIRISPRLAQDLREPGVHIQPAIAGSKTRGRREGAA